MLLIYVAGRYRGPTREAVDLNIATATMVGRLVAERGHFPVIPHLNTAHFERLMPDVSDQFYLDGTMALMLRCDGVVLCPGWQASNGTLAEIDMAARHGIPVYGSVEALPAVGKRIAEGRA